MIFTLHYLRGPITSNNNFGCPVVHTAFVSSYLGALISPDQVPVPTVWVIAVYLNPALIPRILCLLFPFFCPLSLFFGSSGMSIHEMW